MKAEPRSGSGNASSKKKNETAIPEKLAGIIKPEQKPGENICRTERFSSLSEPPSSQQNSCRTVLGPKSRVKIRLFGSKKTNFVFSP
jgi:hypothetical protein